MPPKKKISEIREEIINNQPIPNKTYDSCLIDAQFVLKLNLKELNEQLVSKSPNYRKSVQAKIDSVHNLAVWMFNKQ